MEVDLGGLQVGEPHPTVVEVTNVGPEPLRVGTVRTEAVTGYPDARGDFTPTPPFPGIRRPFGEVAYLVQLLPFYLDPGESFWVRVTASPQDYGDRRAWLRLYATADSNPSLSVWTQALLVADGIVGPTP